MHTQFLLENPRGRVIASSGLSYQEVIIYAYEVAVLWQCRIGADI
jgi:hypothetical protein